MYNARSLAQAPVHETPLLEGHPPLAWLACPVSVEPLDQPRSQLLTDLSQVLAKIVCIIERSYEINILYHATIEQKTGLACIGTTAWGSIMRIQLEVGVPRDGEIVNSKGVEHFRGLDL